MKILYVLLGILIVPGGILVIYAYFILAKELIIDRIKERKKTEAMKKSIERWANAGCKRSVILVCRDDAKDTETTVFTKAYSSEALTNIAIDVIIHKMRGMTEKSRVELIERIEPILKGGMK